MILDSRNSDALRNMLRTGGGIRNSLDRIAGFTLPGLMEMIATACGDPKPDALVQEIQRHIGTDGLSPVREAWTEWHSGDSSKLGGDIHGTRRVEFYRLRRREDQTSTACSLFQERFVRSLKGCEFDTKFAQALAGALAEMTDNVIQHSRREPGEYSGLASYHVEKGYMAFAVIDVGQGMLASLARSPNWRHLQSAEQALRAAVCDHASSRPDQPEGEGFRTLFKSLAERNCRLRFRSDDAVLQMKDAGDFHEASAIGSPSLRGLQLSVCCVLRGEAEEVAILPS